MLLSKQDSDSKRFYPELDMVEYNRLSKGFYLEHDAVEYNKDSKPQHDLILGNKP
jgi:hypothetical protein